MLLEALALMVCIGVAIVILFAPARHLYSPSCIFLFWWAKLGMRQGRDNSSLSAGAMMSLSSTQHGFAGDTSGRKTRTPQARQPPPKRRGGARPPGGSKNRARAKKAGDASEAARKGAQLHEPPDSHLAHLQKSVPEKMTN